MDSSLKIITTGIPEHILKIYYTNISRGREKGLIFNSVKFENIQISTKNNATGEVFNTETCIGFGHLVRKVCSKQHSEHH